MRVLFCIIIVMLSSTALYGQQIRPLPSAKILGELKKLQSLTSVLYVAAHPDDENTRLLSWLATGRNIRTGYLSLTRGDGGQNIIGSEQGAPLGLIRTHELLAARRLDGAEQYFTRAIDFGFSKNPQETFRQWDSITLIADVVRVIREFRPDVVICRFPKDSMAGHGQHSASAIVAEHAVRYCLGTSLLDSASKARIDSVLTSNPIVTGVGPWKPKRLLFNAFRFGNRSTIKPGMFKVDVGQYDPLIGMGYGELAGISRSIHRSQGAGTPSTPGVQPEYFETLAGEPPTTSLFDGIDTTWKRTADEPIAAAIDSIISSFDMTAPYRSLEQLLNVRAKIHEVRDPFWNQQKSKEIDRIIYSCIGLTVDLSVPVPMMSIGDTSRVTLRWTSRSRIPINVMPIELPGGALIEGFTPGYDSVLTFERRFSLPAGTPVSEPFWLSQPADGAFFRLSQETLLGFSVSPPVLEVPVMMSMGYETFIMNIPVSFKKLDPLRGDVIEELRTIPPVSIEPLHRIVYSKGGTAAVTIRLRAFSAVLSGSLQVFDGQRLLVQNDGLALGAQTDSLITVTVPIRATGDVRVGLKIGSVLYDKHVVTITYDHLPTLQYMEPATVRVVAEKIELKSKRVGFITGAGEFTPEFLRGIGVVVDELQEEQILKTDQLLGYDAVIVGIRAVNTRKNIKYALPALMRYAQSGGTVIMQYNTLQDLATTDIAPLPLTISRSRVTEEDAAVTVLLPEHPLLTTPNRISAEDFQGWVQERSVYNPGPYDTRYQELLEMHDRGEQPQRGTLLYAKVGKGHFIYTSLSLFRQLPAGVVGAMKLFANMVSMH
ncbi:MAG: PIG-L family deacetylase [Ignavibacteria bacterium]|jgi:hypothetical protein